MNDVRSSWPPLITTPLLIPARSSSLSGFPWANFVEVARIAPWSISPWSAEQASAAWPDPLGSECAHVSEST